MSEDINEDRVRTGTLMFKQCLAPSTPKNIIDLRGYENMPGCWVLAALVSAGIIEEVE